MSENAVTTTAKKAGQKVKVTFKTITDPARRRVGVAVLVGIIAGIFSGIIKFGWEVPFPPRTPERNSTNPPQALLEQIFGMSPETSHATYSYLGNDLPYMSFIIHFSFAIFFAALYCVVAEYWPKIWYRPGHPLPRHHHARHGYRARSLEPALRRALLRILRPHYLALVHRTGPPRFA